MFAVADKVMKRVRARGRGWGFTPTHFIDYGTRDSVDMALSRPAQAVEVRRVGRGLYDFPKLHHKLGALTPDAEMIALSCQSKPATSSRPRLLPQRTGSVSRRRCRRSRAIRRRGRTRVRIAAGPSVALKHRRAPVLDNASETANGVVQLLAGLGRNKVDANAIAHLSARLDDKDLAVLLKGRPVMPGWMGGDVLRLNAHRRGAIGTITGDEPSPEGLY